MKNLRKPEFLCVIAQKVEHGVNPKMDSPAPNRRKIALIAI